MNREGAARYANESTVELTASPGRGKLTILVASSASLDEREDVSALARSEIAALGSKTFDELLADNRQWWHAFWSRSYIQMHSDDGAADFVEESYTKGRSR